MRTDIPASFLPLSPAVLHVLLALVGEDRHGYAIMQAIRTHSGGEYKIGPGTLYDNLQKLMEKGFVEESRQPATDEDARRRYYRLTSMGKRVLAAELNRLEQIVRAGKALLKPNFGARA